MNRVLILNHEPIGARMTGPTIRNWEFARQLARVCTVTIAAPGTPERAGEAFEVVSMDGAVPGSNLPALIAGADVVIAAGYLLEKHPALYDARHLVVDLNGPFTLENLHMHAEEPMPDQVRIAVHDAGVLTRLIRAGDVFLCSGERQRDFWTGWMAAVGRVNPVVHAADPGFDRVFKLVPFGLSDDPPVRFPARYRGAVEGIADDDFIVMWSSGIWNWFDPLTLIHAVAGLRERLPKLRLVFPAPTSPSSGIGPMGMADRARALADELGVAGRSVFFGSWTVYEERGSVLMEADVATSLHTRDIETRYSFRTRMLDWFWTGLPILTTEGDILSEVVRDEDLGEVVPYGDVDAVAAAIIRLEGDRQRLRAQGERSRLVAQRYTWSRVTAPLVEYCLNPYQSPDRETIRAQARSEVAAPETERRRLARRAVETLREQGAAGLARKGAGYVRKLTRPPR